MCERRESESGGEGCYVAFVVRESVAEKVKGWSFPNGTAHWIRSLCSGYVLRRGLV